jgi:hypothetical protein
VSGGARSRRRNEPFRAAAEGRARRRQCGRGRPGPGSALLSGRALSAAVELTPRHSARKSAGHLERPDGSALGQQKHHQHQQMDSQIVRDLFDATQRAAELLGVDAALRERVRTARALLPPNQIGKQGQLQEWLEDWDAAAAPPARLSPVLPLPQLADHAARHARSRRRRASVSGAAR